MRYSGATGHEARYAETNTAYVKVVCMKQVPDRYHTKLRVQVMEQSRRSETARAAQH